MAELEEQLRGLKANYLDKARQLTDAREKAARRLEKAMAEEFSILLMPEMAFEVRMAEKGLDKLRY